MIVEPPAAPTLTDAVTARDEMMPALIAVAIFAGLSLYCGLRSQGFISGDACMHFLSASYAFSNPKNFVDVWNRPVVTMLYAGPAWLGGRSAVRAVCMLVAIACGWVSWRIAAGQGARSPLRNPDAGSEVPRRAGSNVKESGSCEYLRTGVAIEHTGNETGLKWPVLALFFTLGQPMLFLHSFGEMTELPFALMLGLAFLSWQRHRLWPAAILVAWTPLARPEGFGIALLVFFALLLGRKWRQALILPIPIVLWDVAGWLMTGRHGPCWHWLQSAWPYAGKSLYGSGSLFTFIVLLPAVVSPIVMPAMWIGMWRSLAPFSLGAIAFDLRCFRSPLLVLRERVRVRALSAIPEEDPHPDPLPEYQEREKEAKRDSPPSPLSTGEREQAHLGTCVFLTAALPLFVLVVHSLLYWLGKMASYGEVRYLLVVAPFWGVLSARGWEWAFTRLRWRHPLGWAGAAVLLPPIVANAFFGVVPVPLAHDWQSARTMVQWYQSDPVHISHPRFMASHPGVFYFLGIDPYASARVRGWGKPSLASHPADTILIWDPNFSSRNASANMVLDLDEIRQAGWKEIEAPRLFENDPNVLRGAEADPKDPHSYWHVFVSGD